MYVQVNINGLCVITNRARNLVGRGSRITQCWRGEIGVEQPSVLLGRSARRAGGMRYQRLGGRPSLLKPIIHARSALCGNREFMGSLAPADQN